jgi:hypothetical protein
MARDFTAVLQQAMEFFVAGQIVEARALLLDVVRADSKQEAGWMFLSYTLEDPKQKADCYRKVLAINPRNAEAREALKRIEAEQHPEVKPPLRTKDLLEAEPKPTKELLDEASQSAPSQSDGLLHAAPFTVDIEKADADISFMEEVAAPQPGEEKAETPVTPPDVPIETAAPEPKPAPTLPEPPGRSPVPAEQQSAQGRKAPASSASPEGQPIMPTPRPVAAPPAKPVPSPEQSAAVGLPKQTQPPKAKPVGTPQPSARAATPKPPIPPFFAEGEGRPAGKKAAAVPAGAPHARKPAPAPSAGAGKAGEKPASGAGAKEPSKRIRPVRTTGKPGVSGRIVDRPPEAQDSEPPKKKRNFGCTCLIVAVVLVLIAAGIGVGLWLAGYIPETLWTDWLPTQPAPSTPAATHTPISLITLPPEWTPTPTRTITLKPTITSTPTPTQSPTFITPDETVQADMEKVMRQVENLRGLTMDEALPVYLVTQQQAEGLLEMELDRTGYRENIEDESKALMALGFIKPTYDLTKNAFDRLANGDTGFYAPEQRTIFLIGTLFGGWEKWYLSYEYDYALVHARYPAVGIIEDDPFCMEDSQRCEAIRALVEGDAFLLMIEWLEKYGTDPDLQDIRIEQIAMPFMIPLKADTPPYVLPSFYFPYLQGGGFVLYFQEKGNWARVNELYENLPVSTEQIMHPDKYEKGEVPIEMDLPDVQTVLGESWTLVKSDTLGEFMTYLMLAYGVDIFAQISYDQAMEASIGWGGDHYLVFSSEEDERLLLSAEWAWDTDKDATEFHTWMKEYLDMRFRGEQTEAPAGDCWTMNDETTCLFRSGRNILWVLGPEMDLLNSVRAAYERY